MQNDPHPLPDAGPTPGIDLARPDPELVLAGTCWGEARGGGGAAAMAGQQAPAGPVMAIAPPAPLRGQTEGKDSTSID